MSLRSLSPFNSAQSFPSPHVTWPKAQIDIATVLDQSTVLDQKQLCLTKALVYEEASSWHRPFVPFYQEGTGRSLAGASCETCCCSCIPHASDSYSHSLWGSPSAHAHNLMDEITHAFLFLSTISWSIVITGRVYIHTHMLLRHGVGCTCKWATYWNSFRHVTICSIIHSAISK